jgi:hypothetical protein
MRTNNHTMNAITLYLGLDVHKDSITIAIAEPSSKGEIRPFGTITSDIDRLEKALGRIRKAHPGAQLEVAYEAGPCGFVIARRLKRGRAFSLNDTQLHGQCDVPSHWCSGVRAYPGGDPSIPSISCFPMVEHPRIAGLPSNRESLREL